MRQGPLTGLKVVEFAGLGPAPFCGMLLSDLGAEVLRIDRKGGQGFPFAEVVIARGRRSVALDLKLPEGVETCLRLVAQADVLIEGFRPGVMERLGLGPEVALARNPKLVYGRMTGWGQNGPLAEVAAHDINYIALTGALHAIGLAEKPVAPINLLGDFGGGALYLAFGVLAAVLHARETGQGQVVDAAMTDGVSSLMGMIYGMKAIGDWRQARAANMLDGGAHFYDTYQCADGRWISLGAIEPQFYSQLIQRLDITDPEFARHRDEAAWPELKRKLAQVIAGKTRDEWCALLEGTDVCFAPVLDMDEAPRHPHNQARGTFIEVAGVTQPAPAPRFSATPGAIQRPPPSVGQHDREGLGDWGFGPEEIETLIAAGVLAAETVS